MEDVKENATAPKAVETKVEAATEGAEQNTPEQAAPEKSARDVFFGSVREFNPEGNYDEDEEEFFRSGNEMIKALKEKGEKYDAFTEKLLNRFKNDPEDAEVFLDYAEGMPLVSAIVKNKGREGLSEPGPEDEGYADFTKQLEENRGRRAANEALVEEIRKNSEETAKRFDELAKAQGWSDEEKEAVWSEMFGDIESMSKGNLTDAIMNRYVTSRNRDKDVAAALEQGRADGRNEKIDAERRRMAGSGLPNGNSGSEIDSEIDEPATANPTADWLKNMPRHR